MRVKPAIRCALLFASVLALPAWLTAAQIRVGDEEAVVYRVLGPPSGQADTMGKTILFYEGGVIEVKDGKVVRVDHRFAERARERQEQRLASAQSKSVGATVSDYVSGFGAWVSEKIAGGKRSPAKPGASAAPIASAVADVVSDPPVQTISNGGKRLDVQGLVVPGKVTLIDFYADWCPPCQRMSPKLELLATQDPEVYLRKVDIVKWGTEVALQYNIQSIPHIYVYDRNGALVGEPTSSFDDVVRYVGLAK